MSIEWEGGIFAAGRGGKRENAGRKPGSGQKKYQIDGRHNNKLYKKITNQEKREERLREGKPKKLGRPTEVPEDLSQTYGATHTRASRERSKQGEPKRPGGKPTHKNR